jgi:hypothetical protein
MSPMYLVFGALAVKSRRSRSGTGGGGRFGQGRGLTPAQPQPQPGDAVFPHDPSDAFVVDVLAVVAQLGGDAGAAVGAVPLGVHGLDPFGKRGIGLLACGAARSAGPPFVEAGAGDLQHGTQPLHVPGAVVVLDELAAVHQVISAAKNFVALRRMSRSVASFRFSLRTVSSSARRAAISASSSSLVASLTRTSFEFVLVIPLSPRRARSARTQLRNVSRLIPRSLPMPSKVWLGSDGFARQRPP